MAVSLDETLAEWTGGVIGIRDAVAKTVQQLAIAAVTISDTVSHGALGAAFAGMRDANAAGDIQRDLDVHADELFLGALRGAPVAIYASEELDAPVTLDPTGAIAIAIDPLDGSSNIELNVSIGTIFSILPMVNGGIEHPVKNFLQPGRNQIAAGFFIYGPQLSLVLTLGAGVQIFTWSTRQSAFILIHDGCTIAPRTEQFAVNISNYRHWDEEVRLYVDDCLKGAEGPREKDFNMRWVASLVVEAYRILIKGGIFLYPSDHRKGYGHGRLRLVYEANPVALLIEQAGGAATNTVSPILDLVPATLHQRTPLAFGATREVAWIGRYHDDPSAIAPRSPLFGKRGLLKA